MMEMINELKIIIRVDSSSIIGSGHIMRCLTLADSYRKKGHKVRFICRDLPGNMVSLVERQGYDVSILPMTTESSNLTGYEKWLTVSQIQDAKETIVLLQKIGRTDRLVVDSYAIDFVWEKMLRPLVGEIMVIDDLANRQHDCDILLDQNFYLDKDSRYNNLVPPHCQLLLGPQHALLRDEFFHVKGKNRRRDGRLQNILVFYGGADATCETIKAIQALSCMQAEGVLYGVEITVVVGASNVRKHEIKRLCQQEHFKYLCQVSNMAELMSKADLMLGAGGTITWERCFLGLPAIVTAVAENQFKICEDCSKENLIYYIGKWYDIKVCDVVKAVQYMMNSVNLRALSLSCRLEIGL